jgi:hypothetical protein
MTTTLTLTVDPERLQQDYQALAEMWPELKAELDDEKWMAVENEALAKFEQSVEAFPGPAGRWHGSTAPHV